MDNPFAGRKIKPLRPRSLAQLNELAGASPDDFVLQGTWSENDAMGIRMWKHSKSGVVYYEDHPKVRERGLPVYPFNK